MSLCHNVLGVIQQLSEMFKMMILKYQPQNVCTISNSFFLHITLFNSCKILFLNWGSSLFPTALQAQQKRYKQLYKQKKDWPKNLEMYRVDFLCYRSRVVRKPDLIHINNLQVSQLIYELTSNQVRVIFCANWANPVQSVHVRKFQSLRQAHSAFA